MSNKTEKAAAKVEAAEAAEPTVQLVTMRKAGETLDVHPTCVAGHVAAGWELLP